MNEHQRRHARMLGDLLCGLREEAGITLDDVAAGAGITPAWLRLLEQGRRRTRMKTLMALARSIGGDERARTLYLELVQVALRGYVLHGMRYPAADDWMRAFD